MEVESEGSGGPIGNSGQKGGGDGDLLKRLDEALGRAVARAVSRLISRVFGGSREQRVPVRTPGPEESASIQEEPPEYTEQTEEAAAEAESLLHRLAAGGPLSRAGTTLCQRLLEENRGYEPHSVLEAAIGESQFSPEDLAKIAAFLVSVYYDAGADTSANESVARRVFEGLAERGVATPELVKLCVQALADAPCISLTRPVGEYLKKAGGRVAEYRATVIAAFNSENYSGYCRKQPEEEKRAPPATWNEWEGCDAWSHAGQDWPLAELYLDLATGGEIDNLLAQTPPAGVPAEHTLHYFLLRRSWLDRRESPGSLRAVGRLLCATAGERQWKPLHDRAVLVFRDHWNRVPFGRVIAMAAEVYQGLLELQPRVDPGNPPEPLEGMSCLPITKPQRPQPEEAKAAAPPELLLPSNEALLRRFERLRAEVDERPDNPGAWHEIAEIYRELSLWDKAIIAEDLAIQYHPNFAAAYYGRGKARMESHHWAEAIADFTAAIRLWEFPGGLEKFLTLEEPREEYVDCYRTRGVARAHQGDHDAAIGDVSTAIRLRRHNARLHYELAYLEERAGRSQDARVDAYDAGLLYLDRGEKEEAAACVALLERLGAYEDAGSLRIRMAARKPSDLPL